MGMITSIFARRVIQAAGESLDQRDLLLSVGLNPDGAFDVTEMLADHTYYDLSERIARAMPNGHELPLRTGRLMRPNDYGALGLAWKSAPTVRQSMERVARYCRLWTDNMTYELRRSGQETFFLLHRAGARRLGMRLSNESTVASAVSLIRQTAAQGFAPRAVYLKHDAPPETSAHEKYFRCPVHFSADKDALELSDADLALQNKLGDDGISHFLISHLDTELEKLQTDPTLEALVQKTVSESLSEGVPRMAYVARRLGMSERTLQRRLADKGISFQSLVEDSRRHLAEGLLHQSRYSLSEVAFLTGFSEQSAFNRAFKRWVGRTPTAFRKDAQSAPA